MDQGQSQTQVSLLTENISSTNQKISKLHRKCVIGMGAYGKVELVESNGKQYALKIIDKKKLERNNQQYQASVEKQILTKSSHPGIIKLFKTFQDRTKLYFCLQYCSGGDFINFINHHANFLTPEIMVFYVAQIVEIIAYLQKIEVVHRDLKPENILVTESGHLKLIDFATADISHCKIISEQFRDRLSTYKLKRKQENQIVLENNLCDENEQKSQFQQTQVKSPNISDAPTEYECETEVEQNHGSGLRNRKGTFVGTCYYLAPEMLENDQCSFSSDLWALGCIIYQLYFSELPFNGKSEYEIFEKILNAEVEIPNPQSHPILTDLILKLLKKNPKQRLGCGSRTGLMMDDLKSHPFFSSIKSFPNIFYQEPPPLLSQQDLSGKLLLQYHVKNLKRNPDVIYQGFIEKRTFINYNFYYLAVLDSLELIRIKAEEPQKYVRIKIEIKGSVDELPAEVIDGEMFRLATKQKMYKFKCCDPHSWTEAINKRYIKLAKGLMQQGMFSDKSESKRQINQ